MNYNKIAWLTDIHLNFLKLAERVQFYNRVAEIDADKILITGDIAEAKEVCEILVEFSQHVNTSIYFVLGNHDYYFGSVTNVRENIQALCKQNRKLVWHHHAK